MSCAAKNQAQPSNEPRNFFWPLAWNPCHVCEWKTMCWPSGQNQEPIWILKVESKNWIAKSSPLAGGVRGLQFGKPWPEFSVTRFGEILGKKISPTLSTVFVDSNLFRCDREGAFSRGNVPESMFRCRRPNYRPSECRQNGGKCRLHLTPPDNPPQGLGVPEGVRW
jgi:hypothetical protein